GGTASVLQVQLLLDAGAGALPLLAPPLGGAAQALGDGRPLQPLVAQALDLALLLGQPPQGLLVDLPARDDPAGRRAVPGQPRVGGAAAAGDVGPGLALADLGEDLVVGHAEQQVDQVGLAAQLVLPPAQAQEQALEDRLADVVAVEVGLDGRAVQPVLHLL